MSQPKNDPPQTPKDPWGYNRLEENASGKLFAVAQEARVKPIEPREDIKEVINKVDGLFPSTGENASGINDGGEDAAGNHEGANNNEKGEQ